MENNQDILVEVKGVSKKFCRSLKRGLAYGLKDVFKTTLGLKNDHSQLRRDEFWALRDINFTLRRGECLGLIGRNGAGKSTLLKILNGLIRPDVGSITMRGRIGAMIELGAGFNPLLTGRENIHINGQLLGFSKEEINDKMQAILDFSEIGEFIDSPVQNYSSGMKVRLGFAVAAQMEPDVLIIDEVLAVGDLGFVLKCFNKMDNLLENTAVIFVSHSMPQVSRICSSIMLLEKGQSAYCGSDVSTGIDMYYSKFTNGKAGGKIFARNEDAELISMSVTNAKENEKPGKYSIERLSDLDIQIELKVAVQYPKPHVMLTFFDKEQRGVGVCPNEEGLSPDSIYKTEGNFNFYRVNVKMPRVNFSKGIYSVSFGVLEDFRSKPLLRLQSVIEFQVLSKHTMWQSIEFEGSWS